MTRQSYAGLYGTEWKRERARWLRIRPACARCGGVADVVDHIEPHRGDRALFWNRKNWQSLCKRCHDSHKQREERVGLRGAFSPDGQPLDAGHHWRTPGGGQNLSFLPRQRSLSIRARRDEKSEEGVSYRVSCNDRNCLLSAATVRPSFVVVPRMTVPSKRDLILGLIHARPGATAAEVARDLLLSRADSAKACSRLARQGLIAVIACEPAAARGRPAHRYGPAQPAEARAWPLWPPPSATWP